MAELSTNYQQLEVLKSIAGSERTGKVDTKFMPFVTCWSWCSCIFVRKTGTAMWRRHCYRNKFYFLGLELFDATLTCPFVLGSRCCGFAKSRRAETYSQQIARQKYLRDINIASILSANFSWDANIVAITSDLVFRTEIACSALKSVAIESRVLDSAEDVVSE